MRVVMRTAIALLFALVALLVRVASAQPSEAGAQAAAEQPNAAEAKRLFHEGVELLAAERWLEAEARFRSSVELMPRASSLYNWALSLLALERYGECIEVTDRVLVLADAVEQAEYREHAAKLRERALAAQAEAAATPPPVDAPAPVPATPVATEPTAAQPDPGVVHGPVAAIPTAADDAEPGGLSPGWIVVGGGALVLAGALVTSLLADAADRDFTERCPDARDCDPSLRSLGERTKRLAIATDILLAVGVAAVGTGVTIILLDDGAERGAPSARRVSGAALSLRGRLP